MRIAWMSICGLGVALTLGCGAPASRSPTSTPPGPVADPCSLSGTGTPSDSRISVALLETVQPQRAPAPATASERLLFRHLYQGLTAVRCDGRLWGRLAADWEQLNGGRTWHFHLRQGAAFWDGSPVTARAVVKAWARGAAGAFASMSAGPVRVEALGDRTVRVVTARAEPRLPWLLASPELAIAKRDSSGGWPVGTGPFRLVGRGESQGDVAGTWLAEAFSPLVPSGLLVEFRAAAGMDPRDVMELRPGADVLLTSDPRAVDFALARPGFRAEPLPWDRIYVLTVTRRASSPGEPRIRTATLAPGEDFLESLALDAVRRTARAAQAPYWWDRWSGCAPGVPHRSALDSVEDTGRRETSALAGARLVYQAGDETAADLAERLVALIDAPRRSAAVDGLAELIWGSRDARPKATAEALPPHEFIAAVRTGSEDAYVLDLPRTVLGACQALADLMAADGLLAGLDPHLTRVLLPLVETREHVLIGVGAPSMSVDWDAVPVIGKRGPGQGETAR